MPWAILEVHDVSPKLERELISCLDLISSEGIEEFNLLVIPNMYGDSPIEDWEGLKLFPAEYAILHGYTHLGDQDLRNFLWTDGEGEFASLGLLETYKRIKEGLYVFKKLGLCDRFFVAPAWIGNRYLDEVLRLLGFRAVAYRSAIRDLSLSQDIFSPALSLSNRRWLSKLSKLSLGVMSKIFQKVSILRLAIHPLRRL
ncbi:MAG: DUF2334 domain-containing protein [Aquificaceae bacterium]|nr:DUF2334 domain-containing protein [Aquificaceae bacterium]